MCTNDQYTSPPFLQQQRICRQFILLDEDGQEIRKFQINIAEFLEGRSVNLTSAFKLMARHGLSLAGFRFVFESMNISFAATDQQTLLVDISNLQDRKIPVKRIEEDKQQEVDSQSKICEEQAPKKSKEGERVIRHVLESVKLWRHMHEKNRKLSLTDAAKLLGISKKSLDDYFLQLRLGELYGFDFHNNLDAKIGVLRAHIRKHEVKQLEANLPKAIKSYELVREIQQIEKQMLDPGAQKHGKQHEEKQEQQNTSYHYFSDLILQNM